MYETPVIYDGITACTQNENLKLYCNVRMIQLCISYINKLFQYYIGYNIVELIENEIIHQDLQAVLKKLHSKNIITSFDFSIVPNYGNGEVKYSNNNLGRIGTQTQTHCKG